VKKLKKILAKHSGRGSSGQISVRHQGGRHKRFLRTIDFARSEKGVAGRVESLEYDPNRTANIALILYPNGVRCYILAPEGLSQGDEVIASEDAPINPGNALPLANIPVGTTVHNLEIKPGKGGQMVRSGGNGAQVQSKENDDVLIKLPSGEIRRFSGDAWATVGQLAKVEKVRLRKAGANRRRGKRPTVRGVAMHPGAHPHGGGEGRSGEGMIPKTPWGKQARGVKTRKRKKYSDKLIVERKKK
tara:strand:- start:79 stop:813 length:735 start_codon:yes stop_codon:yes gene_type:complete